MTRRHPSNGIWPMERKFALWLADHRLSLSTFAQRHGFAQQTLHGWMKCRVRIPAVALATIARATSLPEAYWLDDDLPYPPPLDYLNSRGRASALLSTLGPEDLAWVIEVTGDATKLRGHGRSGRPRTWRSGVDGHNHEADGLPLREKPMRAKSIAMAGLGLLVAGALASNLRPSRGRPGEHPSAEPSSVTAVAELPRSAVGSAVKTFDRIKGRWELSSKAAAAFDSDATATAGFESLTLTATTSWEDALGPNAVPTRIALYAVCKSDRWKFLKSHDLSLLIDGTERYSSHGTHDATLAAGFVVETVIWTVPPKCIRALAKAHTVEVRLGSYEGRLPRQTIAALSDFVETISGPSK